MDLSRFLLVMSGLFFLSVDQSGEARFLSFASVHVPEIYQEGYSWTGNFKVPITYFEKIWAGTRWTDDRLEQIVFSDYFHWDFSLKVGEVTSVQGRPNIDPFRYVQMKVFCDENSVDLAYFTTRSSHHNVKGVFVVDSISWSDGVITVKRGQDDLVLNIEMYKDRKGTMPRYESWYPYQRDLDYCQIYDINPDKCDTAREILLEYDKDKNDICFENVYDGDSCEMRMTIVGMTGIFFEKFMLPTMVPVVGPSSSGYYLNGTKDFNIVYPCWLDSVRYPSHCRF